MPGIDLEKATRETIRWYILVTINSGRPVALSEAMILSTLEYAGMRISERELRRELDYLRDRKLIDIGGENTPMWAASLTSLGVDVVEYTADCKPGIARPAKYWT